MGTSSGSATADRVAQILLLFAEGEQQWGVTSIARELDLSKTVVHRSLHSLAAAGLLRVDETTRAYQPGPGLAALGAQALRQSDLRAAALVELHRLQQQSGETATVSELVGLSRFYLDQVPSEQEIKMTVELGQRYPLHAGSSGKSILAFMPEDLRESVLAGDLRALTHETPTDPESVRTECAQIREQGFGHSLGERQAGAHSIAAPVFGPDGLPVGSISVCGPAHRMPVDTLDAFAPAVIASARTISATLGHRPSRDAAS